MECLNHKKINEEYKRLAFFVKPGLDSFLNDIIGTLSQGYETRKITVIDWNQVDDGMQWADICWFEWCDELIIYASKQEIAKEKHIICRLHSYEAFTNYPEQVDWNMVNTLICDVEHIRDVVLRHVNIDMNKISLIPVGVDTSKFVFRDRKKGFNVAYVGYINYKKGPMLLLHFIHALVKTDKRYKLHICGQFQDERYVLYFQQMIIEMGLQNNITYVQRVENVNDWLEDKDYIVSTSLLEGQHLTVMEGMCKGIKPIIHNFVGAKKIYESKYVWNTLDEAVEMIISDQYDSAEYRKFIIYNYDSQQQLNKIKQLISNVTIINAPEPSEPLVTIGIINYNYSQFLDRCIESVLVQTYKNIEILIIDDCSVDGSIEKIKGYEKQYQNIRGIYHNGNSGSAVLAIQEVIREARGVYQMTLSADDFLASESAVAEFLDELIRDIELDYVYSDFRVVTSDEKYYGVWKYKQYTREEIIRDTFSRGGSGVLAITAGFYKTDFFRANNLTWYDDEENKVAGDTLNSLIFIKNNLRYKHIAKELICYRHHSRNMTYDLKNRIKSIVSVLEYIVNNFKEETYLPEITWENFSVEAIRCSTKYYLIGNHYVNLLNHYDSNSFTPWDGSNIDFTSGQIKEFVQPLVEKALEYYLKSLELNDKFYSEIRRNMEYLKKYQS